MKNFKDVHFRDILIDNETQLNLVGEDGDGKKWLATRTWFAHGILCGDCWEPLDTFRPQWFTRLQIEVYHKADGSWLGGAYIDSRHYVIVDSSSPEAGISLYIREDENESRYACKTMVSTIKATDLEEGWPFGMLYKLITDYMNKFL